MSRRFVYIWFPQLRADWFVRHQLAPRDKAFVLSLPDHGRIIVSAASTASLIAGIRNGMTVADARVLLPSLEVLEDRPGLNEQVLKGLADYAIRYSPFVAIDPPDGIIIDATGCAHLWKGEKNYLSTIEHAFSVFGYHVQISIADTIGAAWALSHYAKNFSIAEKNQPYLLLSLPVESLRIPFEVSDRLHTLGLHSIQSIATLPRPALRRRFGPQLVKRLDQLSGREDEAVLPVIPVSPWQERLPCFEPISTRKGIEIALENLLKTICEKLKQEGMGIRQATFSACRIDGKTEKIMIGTHAATHHATHLFHLFQLKIETIEPGPGIDLFILDANRTDTLSPVQEKLWQQTKGLTDVHLRELLDRVAIKFGAEHIRRFIPAEHYWPERSINIATSLEQKKTTAWKFVQRPVQLLSKPEPIQVTAPVPDYPPMNFRYKGKLHTIVNADGPERIEQEWWLQQGLHRDYYCVEDEEGKRYWLFRAGHYTDASFQWFIHGFFA